MISGMKKPIVTQSAASCPILILPHKLRGR